jgi:hypothetical protein
MPIVSAPGHQSAAALPEHVAEPIDADAATAALKHSPRGALFAAGISSMDIHFTSMYSANRDAPLCDAAAAAQRRYSWPR